MATIQDIKQRAQQVKDATQIGENTANRVGGVLVDMADHLDDNENQLSSLLPLDAVPTPNSVKPVQSGGVYNSVEEIDLYLSQPVTDYTLVNFSIREDGTFGTSTIYKHAYYRVQEGEQYYIKASSGGIRFAYVTSLSTAGGVIPFVDGTFVVEVQNGGGVVATIPSGCVYLIFNAGGSYLSELYEWRNRIPRLEEEAEKMRPEDSQNDLSIEDEDNRAIVIFSGGHIQTKNFNSRNVTPEALSRFIDSYLDQSVFTISEWQGKRLSILGDSISTFGVPDQNNATGTWTYPGNKCRYPQSDLFIDVKYQYWYKLLQKLGMVLGINESWRGTRVSNTQANNDTPVANLGPDRCMASLTRIRHLGENGTPDLIIVYGGTNDVGGGVSVGTFDTTNPENLTEEEIAALPVNNFANAYRTMLIRLQYYYPLAKIVVCFPAYTSYNSVYTATNLDKYEEVIREACDFFGVEYIDLRTCGINLWNKATYLPDGIHPNAAGMELIYQKIFKSLVCK